MTSANIQLLVDRLGEAFGPFPAVTQALDHMTDIYGGAPYGGEPRHIMFIGESGVGKSTMLRRFLKDHPPVEHEDRTEVPVVYLEVPSRASVSALASATLFSMGSTFWDKGTRPQLTTQLMTLLRECGTRIVVFDEMNHLVDRGGQRTHHDAADWIKQLGMVGGVSLVLAGTPRTRRLLDVNDQLRNRFGTIVTLHPFSVENGRANEFARVLRSFLRLLDGLPCLNLADEPLLRATAFATGGRLRSIRNLLVRSVQLAATLPQAQIDLSVLERAFKESIYSQATPERNPFSQHFNGLPLTKAGEPYAPEAQ